MIDPIEKQFTLQDGSKKTYTLTKFPAIAGREIISKYPLSSLPKIGDYETNKEVMLKLMSYVFVELNVGANNKTALSSQALIDNHVESWEVLAKIEIAMIEYNCSFFRNGQASNFLEDLASKAPEWIMKTLTPLLQRLSNQEKPLGEN